MKRVLVMGMLFIAFPLQADTKMDVILQQGTSAYESGDYQAALSHFSAGLVYALQSDESTAYPASYLCAIWHQGRGVEPNQDRARRACRLAQGDKSPYELKLFKNALRDNSASDSPRPFKKALGDAADALAWYLKRL